MSQSLFAAKTVSTTASQLEAIKHYVAGLRRVYQRYASEIMANAFAEEKVDVEEEWSWLFLLDYMIGLNQNYLDLLNTLHAVNDAHLSRDNQQARTILAALLPSADTTDIISFTQQLMDTMQEQETLLLRPLAARYQQLNAWLPQVKLLGRAASVVSLAAAAVVCLLVPPLLIFPVALAGLMVAAYCEIWSIDYRRSIEQTHQKLTTALKRLPSAEGCRNKPFMLYSVKKGSRTTNDESNLETQRHVMNHHVFLERTDLARNADCQQRFFAQLPENSSKRQEIITAYQAQLSDDVAAGELGSRV